MPKDFSLGGDTIGTHRLFKVTFCKNAHVSDDAWNVYFKMIDCVENGANHKRYTMSALVKIIANSCKIQ